MIRRELVLSIVFVLLSFVAFAPLLIISLGAYEGNTYHKVESLLADRQELLIALGTLFLVVGLSALTSHLSTKSIERREIVNLRTQAELKISDFRQAWINELRDDYARLISISNEGMTKTELVDYQNLWARIQLRLNPLDDEHTALILEMLELTEAIHNGDGVHKATSKIQIRVNLLLKNEWERLKNDLKSAQQHGEDAP